MNSKNGVLFTTLACLFFVLSTPAISHEANATGADKKETIKKETPKKPTEDKKKEHK